MYKTHFYNLPNIASNIALLNHQKFGCSKQVKRDLILYLLCDVFDLTLYPSIPILYTFIYENIIDKNLSRDELTKHESMLQYLYFRIE